MTTILEWLLVWWSWIGAYVFVGPAIFILCFRGDMHSGGFAWMFLGPIYYATLTAFLLGRITWG